jgi:hypothetical protein
MTLEQSCKKYGITGEEYNIYKTKSEEHIYFESIYYPHRVFVNPDPKVSGLEYFDTEADGKYYRFYYNKNLTDKKKILDENRNGENRYPEIIYPPFEVTVTEVRNFKIIEEIPGLRY